MDENLKRLYVYLECAKHNAFAQTVSAVRIYINVKRSPKIEKLYEQNIELGAYNQNGIDILSQQIQTFQQMTLLGR